MFRLIGFAAGIGAVIFILQPWLAENYPDIYEQGREAADMTVTAAIEKTQAIASVKDTIEPEIFPAEKIASQTDSEQVVGETAEIEMTNTVPEPEPEPEKHSIPEMNSLPAIVIRQAFWTAFKYKTSAEGFARKITEQTQISVLIEQDTKQHYQLFLEAGDEVTIEQQILQIEQALGLKISQTTDSEMWFGVS